MFSGRLVLTLTFLAMGLSFISDSALANVSLKNGNFYMAYKDIFYPGGIEPSWDRTFNSKTGQKGYTGWGWNSAYETYIVKSADGSLMVHEYGGGADNRFTPLEMSRAEIDKAVNSIAVEAQKVGLAPNLSEYKDKLTKDPIFRNEQWENFVASGKLQPRQLPMGAQFKSTKFSYQFITKTKDGYVRKWESGKIELFFENGKLMSISDRNNNFIKFTYGKDGHVQSMVDNFNRKMFFTFNKQGLLEKIEGENGKTVTYEYYENGDLKKSKDVDNHVYEYTYDKRHNLTQIKYQDGTTLEVQYYGLDKQENVKRVKNRDGTVSDYSYEGMGSNHLVVSIAESTGPEGAKTENGKYVTRYEYFYKQKADGEEWTSRIISSIYGDVSDTFYDEKCDLPSKIYRGGSYNATQHTGGEMASFTYDVKCHVQRKETPTEITNLQYDAHAGKVSFVERFRKRQGAQPQLEVWAKYKYEGNGNLESAQNSDKKTVALTYDRNGRIKLLVDQAKRKIIFDYNNQSKPIRITIPNLGAITVNYNNSGAVEKVNNPGGEKVPQMVTAAFENLADIINPAGVTLSF